MRLFISFAMLSVAAFPLMVHGQTDDITKKLDEAKREHGAATKKAKDRLLAEFEKKSDEIRAGKLAAEKKVVVLDALKKEREQFELEEKLPSSVLMTSAVSDYKRTTDVLVEKLDAAFAAAIDASTKAKDDARAKSLLKERQAAIIGAGHELVGDWLLESQNGVGMLEKWTVAKVRGQWSVTGRYYTSNGKQQIGECVGREFQFVDGALQCRQYWVVKPNSTWKSGYPLVFKSSGASPDELTMGTQAPDEKLATSRLVRMKK